MQGFDRMWLRVVADKDEHIYGGGEQFSYFDLRDHSFPIWTREQGTKDSTADKYKYTNMKGGTTSYKFYTENVTCNYRGLEINVFWYCSN